MTKLRNLIPLPKMMRITTQDEDEVMVSGIYTEVNFSPLSGEYFGYNVYGYVFSKKVKVLLGTYGRRDAEQIVREIKRLKPEHYTMPESIEDEEIIELIEGRVDYD